VFEGIDSRFLGPGCGNGNFLVAMLERKIIAINEAEHGGTGHVLVLPIQSSSERRISSVTLRSLSWAMTSNCAHRSQKALAGEGLLVGSGCVAQSLTSPPSTTRFCPDLHAGYPALNRLADSLDNTAFAAQRDICHKIQRRVKVPEVHAATTPEATVSPSIPASASRNSTAKDPGPCARAAAISAAIV